MPPKDLRRLLKQHRTERQKEKRVEHPFAKYDDRDRLICIVCDLPVSTTWPVHLASAAHKESIARLKALKAQRAAPLKRNVPADEQPVPKRTRRLEEEEEEEEMQDTTSQLPADFFDAPSSNDAPPASPPKDAPSSLPPPPSETATAKEEPLPNNEIPRGFFDDPEEEARARKLTEEQMEKELERGYEEFRQAMADLEENEATAEAGDDDEGEEDLVFAPQAECDALAERLIRLSKQRARPVRTPEEKEGRVSARIAYDEKEKVVTQAIKSSYRQLLGKGTAEPERTVFDEMDEDEEEEEEEEEDWRAQHL